MAKPEHGFGGSDVRAIMAATEGAAVISAAGVEDDAYAVGWNGDADHAPSQNAVYDILSTIITDLNGFPDSLKNLAATEIAELTAIGTTTISAAQWGYLGGASANGGALIDAANYAAMMALLSGTATGAFSLNSQNLTSVGTIASAAITSTSGSQFDYMGIGGAPDIQHLLRVVDSSLDKSVSYTGLEVNIEKTAGASNYADNYTGFYARMRLNQASANFGTTYGLNMEARIDDGDIGDVANAKHLYATYALANLRDGKIWGSAFGHEIRMDQAAANEVVGDIFGLHIWADADGTVGGNVYLLYLDADSNVDYGIYLADDVPSYLGGDLDIAVHDGAASGLKLGGTLVTANATELSQCATMGATTISANQWAALGGIAETLAASELDILDGATLTTAELNQLDGNLFANVAVADDARGLSSICTLVTNAKSDGIAAYFEGHIDGITDGPTYGAGAWLNIDSGSTLGADARALDIGIYESGADCSGGNAYGLAIHMEFDDTDPPAGIYPFRINCNDTANHATPDALIFAPNKSAIALTDAAPGTADAYLKIKFQSGEVYRIMLVKE